MPRARKAMRSAAAAAPPPADLHALLRHFAGGADREAAIGARSLIERYPAHPLAWRVIGAVELRAGRHDAALRAMREAVRLAPEEAETHRLLAATLCDLGRAAEAEAACREALCRHPDVAGLHNTLGNALADLGRPADAEASYRVALRLKPSLASAHGNLGIVLNAMGRAAEAVACHREAIRLRPGDAVALSNLAAALRGLGQLEEAESACRAALAARPDLAAAHVNLATVLRERGRPAEAEASCRAAIRLKPGLAIAHRDLGSVLREQGRLEEAAASYRAAIAASPGFAAAHASLGVTLAELGHTRDAAASLDEAIRLDPASVEHRHRRASLMPVVAPSRAAIEDWRAAFLAGLDDLARLDAPICDGTRKLGATTFYLAYHDASDVEPTRRRSRLVRAKCPAASFVAPHVAGWRRIPGRRLKVGICSGLLVAHTIGKLYQGLVRGLDRSAFEVVVIHAAETRHDAFAARLDAHADKALRLPPSLPAQQQAIAAERLDILFYPDIGMSAETYYLAHARLAPVQATSWGHPDTSGIDTIDYFLSSSLIEPDGADGHYAERLIRFDRLPSYYMPLRAPAENPGRAALGLPARGALYGCPQSLFKFHPDFDAVLAGIAMADPGGHIVILEGQQPEWSRLLRARWARSAPVLNDRVVVLPRRPMDEFMQLLAHFDVLLDPVHFGSGNTMYEALVHGTPIVTWPGAFMRGRIVAGGYAQMGIADAPVVHDRADFAPCAVALAHDAARGRDLRARIAAAAASALFADRRALGAFASFFAAAAAAADSGTRLQAGWRPSIDA